VVTVVSRWFVVAKFSQLVRRDPDPVRLPSSAVHAKEMGSLSTACGIPCGTWPKWWDRPFYAEDWERCEDCLAIVERE